MPKIVTVTNTCESCRTIHPDAVDDSERLDDSDDSQRDTELPSWWVEIVIRTKQPNPEWVENEARVRRDVQAQFGVAVQQVMAANNGKALSKSEIEDVRTALEAQVRSGDDSPPELVIAETTALLCSSCGGLVSMLGVHLEDLIEVGNHAPWRPVGPVGMTAPGQLTTPATQRRKFSAPPPVVLAQVETPTADPETPAPAPTDDNPIPA